MYWARLIVVAAVLICGCTDISAQRWQVRFGPVLDDEMVVGRVAAGKTVWLATDRNAIVRIDLDRLRRERVLVRPLRRHERLGGLARTGSGAMWALIAQTTLARLEHDGSIGRRIALRKPHAGIFGTRRNLVFKLLSLPPRVPALEASPPGGELRRAWSALQTPSVEFVPGGVPGPNPVSCGATGGAVIPCWFPDQSSLTFAGDDGTSRTVMLEGLSAVAPQVRAGPAIRRRIILDAFVSADDAVWVLGAGESAARQVGARSGGWLLARYDLDGRLFRRVQLPEPARLVLRGHGETCLLLSWSGQVVEVRT